MKWSKTTALGFAAVITFAALTTGLTGVGLAVPAILVLYAAWHQPALALEVAVALVLVIRPWVDMYSERRAGLDLFAINAAVVIGATVLGIAAIVALHRGKHGKRLWPDNALLKTHGWLAVACGIGLGAGIVFYGSAGLAQGTREAIRVMGIVAAFLVVFWWVKDDDSRYARGWAYLAAGATLPIVVGLWQFSTGRGFLETEGFNRIQGTFSHPNSFGQFLIPFVLVALGETLRRGGFRAFVFGVTAAALTMLAMLTYSRTVVLALAAAVLVLPVLHARRLGFRALIRSGALLLVFTLIAWWLAGSYVRERFANVSLGRGALDAALAGESENSYEWRLLNWGTLVTLSLEHPLVGHGLGMTTVLNPIVNGDNGLPYNAHNDFVRFLFEAGILGLVSYAIYAILLCAWAVRRARVSTMARAPVSFAVAAAWVSLLLLTLGNTELSLHTANLYTLYGMLGLMAGTETTESLNSRPEAVYRLASGRPSP